MSWETVALGNLCEVLDNKRKPITKRDRLAGEIPYYGATGIVDYVNSYIFDEKLVLIGEDGAKWGSGDKTAFIVNGKCWVNNHAHVIKPYRNLLLDEWLVYYFYSKDLNEFVTGLTVPKLNQGQLRLIQIPLPTLVIQQKLVTKLDAVFAEIDKATAAAEANIKNAEALLKATINKISNFSVNRSETKIFSEIVKISSKLVDPKLDQFCDLIHVGAANIVSNTGELIDLKTAKEENLISGKFIFESETILYSKIRPYLKKVAKPNFGGLCSADVYPLIPNPEFITQDFLFYLLLTDDFTNYAINGSARAGMPKINREYLFAYKFNLPDIAEQNKLTEEIFKTFELIKVIKSKYLNILKLLTALKQSILQQAFNGELIKE